MYENSIICIVCLVCSLGSVVGGNVPVLDFPDNFDLNSLNSYLREQPIDWDTITTTSCKRPCIDGQNRICYHKFVVEEYQAMGIACGNCSLGVLADCKLPQCVPADGYERGIITVNRQLPGPIIEVCANDLVVVDVRNQLHAQTLTIHWHGILQRGTPYMDGVPGVTQCPISPASTFRYAFHTPDAGTFFYHSHSGVQRNSGFSGSLIVRQPVLDEPASNLYDHDAHVLNLLDWSHTSPEMFMVGLPTKLPGVVAEAALINGKGKFAETGTTNFTPTPYERFHVIPGHRYRFRVINVGGTVCPFRLQIQDHRMLVIAVDGIPVNPVTVDTLVVFTGERFDFVLTANRGSGAFWIHTNLIGICVPRQIFQSAVLSYNSNKDSLDVPPGIPTFAGYSQGVILNDAYNDCKPPTALCIANLQAPLEPRLNLLTPTQKLYFGFNANAMNVTEFFGRRKYQPFFNPIGAALLAGTINGLSNWAQASPFLSQPNDIDRSYVCEDGKVPSYCSTEQVCACSHVVHIKQKALVEIVLFDQAPAPSVILHPVHFHGLKFSVLAQGIIQNVTGALTVENIKALEAKGLLKSSNTLPPSKDTLTLQDRGFAVIRFIADNPGCWLVHCHIDEHMLFGMALVLKVAGTVPAPPNKFPQCGNFVH